MLFICYPKCTTCKRAREWLVSKGVAFEERDIKTDRPKRVELEEWMDRSGLEPRRFFNTSGKLYRDLGLSARAASMKREEILDLLETDGMLVKRPILAGDGFVLVGFDEDKWEEALL